MGKLDMSLPRTEWEDRVDLTVSYASLTQHQQQLLLGVRFTPRGPREHHLHSQDALE